MARCTLDDLVPSFKCNRVFLEPYTNSYTEYQVKIDSSVYDTVEDDRGLSDYLLSDTFKNNIKLFGVFSRDGSVKKFVDMLNSLWNPVNKTGVSPEFQSYIFFQTMILLAGKSDPNLFFAGLSNKGIGSIFETTSIVMSSQFKNKYISLYKEMYEGSLEYAYFDFASYTNQAIENNGTIILDADGKKYYDIKISKDHLDFTNNKEVKECYFHCICYLDANSVIGLNIPFTKQTIPFFYKSINECHILQDGIAADDNVQDFRSTERIQELIIPDRITVYDEIIDMVSLASTDKNLSNTKLVSDLFSSYIISNSVENPFTKNVFFINAYEICRVNSKLSFMYDNLGATIDTFNILGIDLYRIRKDVKQEREKVFALLEEHTGKIQNGLKGYSFKDTKFSDLTYGEYSYEMDIQFIDPIYEIVERGVNGTRKLLQKYGAIMEYIHNNPQNYNEIRDELNYKAQSDIKAIFDVNNQEMFEAAFMFAILFKALTGINYGSVVGFDLLQYNNGYERRKIENNYRILQDVLFASSRFVEVDVINNHSVNSASSPSKIIHYSKSWKETSSATVFRNGILKVINKEQLSESEYQLRMEQEADTQEITFNTNIRNIGFLTPYAIDDIPLYSNDERHKVFLKLFSNIAKNNKGSEEDKLSLSFFENNPDGFGNTVNEIKDNSGVFETFLSDLGATITNNTLSEIDTKVELNALNRFSVGIDNGENLFNSRNSNHGRIERVTDADKQDIKEQRETIKQNLTLEKAKTEDIAMRIIIDRDGYSMLDRKKYIQGDKLSRSFDYNFNYISNVEGKPYPLLFRKTEKYFRFSENGNGDTTKMPLSRFIMDNTHMVFYLSGFDENMNPQWNQLTDFQKVSELKNSVGYTMDFVLCKLKRFQNSKIQIGQGSASDREILYRYFYLYLN